MSAKPATEAASRRTAQTSPWVGFQCYCFMLAYILGTVLLGALVVLYAGLKWPVVQVAKRLRPQRVTISTREVGDAS